MARKKRTAKQKAAADRKSRAAQARAATLGLPDINGKPRSNDEIRGAPPLYRPEFCQIALEMCSGEDPATDIELADAFGVTQRCVQLWRQRYSDFAAACKLGKAQADDRIERALYHRAHGYSYDSEEIKVIEGKVVRVPVRIHVPPDPTCMMKWLNNRQPGKWRDRVEHTGADGGPLQIQIVRFAEEPGPATSSMPPDESQEP